MALDLPPVTPSAHRFMFATGIENSAPVITGRDGRTVRVDEMAKTGHYERWKEDFALVRDLGLEYLRYGPPYYRTHLGPGRYDAAVHSDARAELYKRHRFRMLDSSTRSPTTSAGGIPRLLARATNTRSRRSLPHFFPLSNFYELCRRLGLTRR